MSKLSFVIPCYGSEQTVANVINEIQEKVKEKEEYDYEIIAVNDSSPDNVLEVLKQIANNNKKVKVIDLAKNRGKHSAVLAGYSAITGDIIIGVDDDGQCPIDQLWRLLEPLQNGYDVSVAKYDRKKQSKFKNLGSRGNALMTRLFIGKPRDLVFSNFTARKRFVCNKMREYTNPYPYLDGLVLTITNKIANVPMEQRERQSGKSGYRFTKSLKLLLNGFTAFSIWPLRAASVIGMLTAIIGFIFGIFIVFRKLMDPSVLAGYSSLAALVLFIGGIIMMLLGMIGEYVGRIYISINKSPQYVIRESINISCND